MNFKTEDFKTEDSDLVLLQNGFASRELEVPALCPRQLPLHLSAEQGSESSPNPGVLESQDNFTALQLQRPELLAQHAAQL